MAEAFNKYFCSTFTHAPEVPLDAFTPSEDGMPVLDSLVLCENVLKTCARKLTPSLCTLFNLSLAEGKLPTEGKDALVVPVHKKGKKEDFTNYRPIPLLCVVSKVLER